jgi:hypothetical protein
MKMGIGMPDTLKVILTVFTVAPVSFALGRPFPLGNASLGKSAATLIPWAWAINGAFSVISTPLANILSNSLGWRIVIAAALLLYVTSIFTFPKTRIEKNETG